MPVRDFPLWPDDASAVCAAIERRRGRLKFVLKTKDETHFLDQWIAHYAAIVGIENLIVFDNMSTDETVLSRYRTYGPDLLVVQYGGFHNLLHEVAVFPALYAALARACDHVMFLDSDEFVTVIDQDRHAAGAAVADFILSAGEFDILPGAWIENLPRSETHFTCGTSLEKFEWGLRWGKPAVRTKADLRGILLHNTQMLATLARPATPLNLFVRHLKSLHPEQRQQVNIAKLAKRGFCAETDKPEDIVRKNLSKVTDPNIKLYVKELREMLLPAPDPQASTAEGTLTFQPDGWITFHSTLERALMTGYLGDEGQRLLADVVARERRGPRARPSGVVALRAAIEDDPADISLRAELAAALMQGGEVDEAAAVCDEALARAPRQADILLRLGLIARRRGDRATAMRHFRDVLRQRPGDAWPSLELSMDLIAVGQLDEAEALCRGLVDAYEQTLHAQMRLGLIARRRGNHAAAIAAFEAALAAEPSSVWAQNELATERQTLGEAATSGAVVENA